MKMWKTLTLLTALMLAWGGCDDPVELETWLNPGCKDGCSEATLVYTRMHGTTTVHHIWDFTHGMPTVLVAATDNNTTLEIVWKDHRVSQFQWSHPPSYSFALALYQIWEYGDVNDTGVWHPELVTRRTDMSLARWHRLSMHNTRTTAHLTVRADLNTDINSLNGSVIFNLTRTAIAGATEQLPHLLLSGNSSLLEVGLANVSGCSDQAGCLPHARLALDILLAADNTSVAFAARRTALVDDEHSPGVFQMVEVVSGSLGYVQYRPVSYTAAVRDLADSTGASDPRLTPDRPLPPDSTLRLYFSRSAQTAQALVCLGEEGDGFYSRTNYTAWITAVGFGQPGSETPSTGVLVLLACGLSLPVLMLLFGAAYSLRRCRRTATHQRL